MSKKSLKKPTNSTYQGRQAEMITGDLFDGIKPLGKRSKRTKMQYWKYQNLSETEKQLLKNY